MMACTTRLLKIPISDYDGIWLGGDICAETSLNPKTIKRLDRIFNLKNPNTHVVLGNHDYRNGNHELFPATTGRPDYYTSSFKNMVVSVLNTNLNSSDCENLNAQFKMIQHVTDTISKASHYVILLHHQIFPEFDGMKGFKTNGLLNHYAMNCDDASSSFEKVVYPRLKLLEARGIEVIVVVGDSGWHKGASSETDAGIDFLASGINNSYFRLSEVPPDQFQEDKLLKFTLDSKARTLSWEFVVLNELVNIEKEKWFSIE